MKRTATLYAKRTNSYGENEICIYATPPKQFKRVVTDVKTGKVVKSETYEEDGKFLHRLCSAATRYIPGLPTQSYTKLTISYETPAPAKKGKK